MNYATEEPIQYNNKDVRGKNYNTTNLKISKRKQRIKTDKNNPEIVEELL